MRSKHKKAEEHMFSIELKSIDHIRSLSLADTSDDCVRVEGFLGKLNSLQVIEDVMLEIVGANGNLRMDFSIDQLMRLLPKGTFTPKKTEEVTETWQKKKQTKTSRAITK